MRPKTVIPYLFLTAILLAVTMVIHAVGTGTIKGQVTDRETGKPMSTVSIQLVGTNLGAITDSDGWFTIKRVEPGTYTLRVTSLNYASVEVVDVKVVADLTVETSVKMSKSVKDLDVTITIQAESDIIDKFEISNRQTVTREEIASKPVTGVEDLLTGVAGVAANKDGEIFIRGGRAGEVAYITDGVPLGDPLGGLGQAGANLKRVPGHVPPPAHGGSAIVNGEPFDAMFFKNHGTNPFVDTEDDHLSTFAIDVDDASYVMMRSYLERGHLPNQDAVRVEEFVNHFTYDYQPPRHSAFAMHVEGAISPFGQNCHLLKIGIKGREVRERDRKPANLVFVIDVSGSMNRENRLGLVQYGLKMMVDQLRADDRVGIVVYGSNGRVVLEPTSMRGRGRRRILSTISQLTAGGSTFAEQGIRLGYKMAQGMAQEGHTNRVILCSDGVANVGQTGPDELLKQINQYADRGITLTTVGFGMGNYNDVLMEKLGDKGNGQYAYIDDAAEARRFFVDNLTGMLEVIARDVKIQVDFDPEMVRSYRLLGYENRDVDDDKFRDDKEDGGEIGAGHQVTALYEVKLHDPRRGGFSESDLGTIYVRYKNPDNEEVTEVKKTIPRTVIDGQWQRCNDDFRIAAAAAEFAEILRGSYWARGSRPGDVLALIDGVQYEYDDEALSEFVELIRKADAFEDEFAER